MTANTNALNELVTQAAPSHDQNAAASPRSSPSFASKFLCCLKVKQKPEPEDDALARAEPVLLSDEPMNNKRPSATSQKASQKSAWSGEVHQEAKHSQKADKAKNADAARTAQEKAKNYLLPPQEERFHGRKTLVLDLDETLVHSSFTPVPCELILTLQLGNEEHKVYVKKRPGVDLFLEKVAEFCEVVIFTASTALYANELLDQLDVHRTITYRLFREACSRFKEGYVKDLSRLGRDLDNVIIIDNLPICYALQPENAIPIKTWRNDPDDRELYDLLPILVSLANVEYIPLVLQEILYDDAPDGPDEGEA